MVEAIKKKKLPEQQEIAVKVSNISMQRVNQSDMFPSFIASTDNGIQDVNIKDGKIMSIMILQGEKVKFTQKYNGVLFVVGIESEIEVLKKGKAASQQFSNNQIVALDYDSQELIGKLFISFMHKIIVCDVFKLKHLIKQTTGDEDTVFDAHVNVKEDKDEITIAAVDEKSKKVSISYYAINKTEKTQESMDKQIAKSIDSMIISTGASTATTSTGVVSAAAGRISVNATITVEDSRIKNSPSKMLLNPEGTLLAVVRNGGKYVHVVDLATKKVKVEMYRGMSKREIKSVAFSLDSNYFALITNENKIHVFYIGPAMRMFDNTGSIVQLNSCMKLNADQISVSWDNKALEKSSNRIQAARAIQEKQDIEDLIEKKLNISVPHLSMHFNPAKKGGLFDLEFISEKGYYYRSCFTNSKQEKGGLEKEPDSFDSYCEIKIVVPTIEPSSDD
ncbi:hypothetical protein FGO68_gene4303 [Halteria grandinella]|uniref:Uncharacterized protein n=1 Tax=Halteria grandinella TaxID=5974 RepID=A0A8J8T383_HALGN|nr:hypothetical protein FGO68_gene4303 [Halteria grandinella]